MMSFQFEAAGEYSEGAYWGRQFPLEVLKRLAENGKSCTDKDGLPIENADPIPVVRMFMASAPAEWLLAYSYPQDPDRVFALVNLGHGWEFGDVLISELKTLRVLGLPIERDRLFKGDRPLSAYAAEELQ